MKTSLAIFLIIVGWLLIYSAFDKRAKGDVLVELRAGLGRRERR